MKTYLLGIVLIIPQTFTSLDWSVAIAIIGWAVILGKAAQWKSHADVKLNKLEVDMEHIKKENATLKELTSGALLQINDKLQYLKEFSEANWFDAKERLKEVEKELKVVHGELAGIKANEKSE